MTREEKELVIRDLSARIPYDTWVRIEIYIDHRDRGNYLRTVATSDILLDGYTLDDYNEGDAKSIKAYLRPMSSMTEEEEKEFNMIVGYKGESNDGWTICDNIHTRWGVWVLGCSEMIDWLNKHHFDYRGLIPKGHALEAPEDMYNN